MAISPISSRPTCEVKPTRAPRTGRLWAKIEQEPPRVRLNPEPSNCRPVGKFLEEAIEDEVEIGFAADGDVQRFARVVGEAGYSLEGPHIVLLRNDENYGYYYLVLVSVWNFD